MLGIIIIINASIVLCCVVELKVMEEKWRT